MITFQDVNLFFIIQLLAKHVHVLWGKSSVYYKCTVDICCFKCSISLKSKGFRLAVSVFLTHWLKKKNIKVIPMVSKKFFINYFKHFTFYKASKQTNKNTKPPSSPFLLCQLNRRRHNKIYKKSVPSRFCIKKSVPIRLPRCKSSI